MSKKLIAGAGVVASLAVALAPMATFAADAGWNSDKHTDTWNVTVLPTCAFGAASATPIDGITHNAASPAPHDNSSNAATWTDGSDDHLGMTPDMAAVEAVAGIDANEDRDYDDEGDTKPVTAITPVEHATTDSAAYSIYAGTADANMGTTTLKVVCNQNAGYKIKVTAANLRLGETANYINVASEPSATATGYKITTSGTADTIVDVTSSSETEAVVKNSASAATGDAFTFTYAIGVAPGTTAGTYTGNVVYTLVQQLGS